MQDRSYETPKTAGGDSKAISSSEGQHRGILKNLFLNHPRATLTQNFLGFDPARRVAVLSEPSEATQRLCGMLKRLRFSPLVLSDIRLDSERWRRTFERFAEVCIADIDVIEKDMDPVKLCRNLRRSHPHLPLIMLSDTYAARNLAAGPERLCDASSPYPEDRLCLAEVISAAQSNCLSRRLLEEMAPV